MGSGHARAIPKAVKMVLVARLLTLATKGYQEDTRKQVGIRFVMSQ